MRQILQLAPLQNVTIFSVHAYPKLGPIARFLGCFTILDMHTAQGTPDQVLNMYIEPYNNFNDST